MGYEWEGEFGLSAIVTGENTYMILTNNFYVYPTEPPTYDSLIKWGKSDYQRDKKSEEHEVLQEAWAMYIVAKELIIEIIRDALYLPYHK